VTGSVAGQGAARGAADSVIVAESLTDPERFSVLYDRYAAMLYRYAARRVGPANAEDAVAATFLAAFAARRRYDLGRQDARPWLFGILTKDLGKRRRAEDARFRALARAASAQPAVGHEDDVARQVSAQSARRALAAALARLSQRDRGVLLLIAWGELSYAEASEALGIPVGTVRSRLNRARRKMREALGGADPTTVAEEGW
jgi:RNA polymerase sigma-70 factor (ECF subfamily)